VALVATSGNSSNLQGLQIGWRAIAHWGLGIRLAKGRKGRQELLFVTGLDWVSHAIAGGEPTMWMPRAWVTFVGQILCMRVGVRWFWSRALLRLRQAGEVAVIVKVRGVHRLSPLG
jgi:hypothetical protein